MGNVNLTPPESAKNNAKKALKWREEYPSETKGAGTSVGWTRARQLADGGELSPDTVKRMASFARHRKNSEVNPKFKSEPWRDKGYLMWLAWGGSSGVDWAIKKSKELELNMDVRVNILTAINAEQIRIDRTMEDGNPIAYIRNHKFLINEIVLNGGLYPADENERAFKTMEGRLFTNGHPKVGGKFVAISNQDNEDANVALESHYMGASNKNVRKSGNDYFKDIRVNINLAKATTGGKKLVEWIENVERYHKSGGDKPSCINTSTGLLCEKKELTGNSRGKNYTWVATNQRYDHDAFLINEAGAGGDEISLAVNEGEEIDAITVNLDDAQQPEKGQLFLPTEESEESKRSFIQNIAEKLGFSVKSNSLTKSSGDKEMSLAQKLRDLLGAEHFVGNETDEQIVKKFKKKHRDQDKAGGVSKRIEEDEEDDEEEELDDNEKKDMKKSKKEVKANSLSASDIEKLIADGIKAGLQANQANTEKAEKETIVNGLIANSAYSEDKRDMLMGTPLEILKGMTFNHGISPIGSGAQMQYNHNQSDEYGFLSTEMAKGE